MVTRVGSAASRRTNFVHVYVAIQDSSTVNGQIEG